MQSLKLVVDESPYCVWGHDLEERNRQFLAGIDPGYFEHIAKIHAAAIESPEERHYAAIALRATYSHALETLFAFLGATAQATRFPAAWILRYQPRELRSLVKKISDEAPIRSSIEGASVSWELLSRVVNNFESRFPGGHEALQVAFAQLWRRFARDFLDEMATEEYNSIKHGLRNRPGGFALSFGVEDVPGVPAPAERMSPPMGCEFGSSFFRVERLEPSHNFWVRSCGRNWHPSDLVHGLNLVAMSLGNVISFLRHVAGEPSEKLEFRWPLETAVFDLPWSTPVGFSSIGFDTIVTQSQITPASKESILGAFRTPK